MQALDAERQIEDILYAEGVHSRVLIQQQEDAVDIEVVFPMDMEALVSSIVSRKRKDISRIANTRWTFEIRTVLFHLAYEVFGTISTPPRVRISTNVKNLRTPLKVATRLLGPDGKTLGEATALRYDVDLVVVSATMPAGQTVFEDAATAARDFNKEARYLKIGALHGAYTKESLISSGERLAFWEISFQDDGANSAGEGGV